MTVRVGTGRLAVDGGTAVRAEDNPLPGVFPREIPPNSRRELDRVVESGFTVDSIGEFESAFADACGIKHAVALANCTSAIHTVIGALGLGRGDEVVVSSITDYGSVAGVVAQGAKAVFPDVDVRTGNVTAETIEEVVTSKTKAIVAVHFYGMLCDMDPIIDLSRECGITLIEDVCQAPLARYKGRIAGAMGDVGCFSFDAEKHLSTDHGGMAITDDQALADAIRKFGQSRGIIQVEGFGRAHDELGYNNRYGRLEAAVGIGQLEMLEGQNERRRQLAAKLTQEIEGIDGIDPPFIPDGCDHVYFMYHIHLQQGRFSVGTDEIAEALVAEGLTCGTARYYLIPAGLLFEPDYPTRAKELTNASKHLETMIRWFWTDKYSDGDIGDMAAIIAKVADAYRN